MIKLKAKKLKIKVKVKNFKFKEIYTTKITIMDRIEKEKNETNLKENINYAKEMRNFITKRMKNFYYGFMGTNKNKNSKSCDLSILTCKNFYNFEERNNPKELHNENKEGFKFFSKKISSNNSQHDIFQNITLKEIAFGKKKQKNFFKNYKIL